MLKPTTNEALLHTPIEDTPVHANEPDAFSDQKGSRLIGQTGDQEVWLHQAQVYPGQVIHLPIDKMPDLVTLVKNPHDEKLVGKMVAGVTAQIEIYAHKPGGDMSPSGQKLSPAELHEGADAETILYLGRLSVANPSHQTYLSFHAGVMNNAELMQEGVSAQYPNQGARLADAMNQLTEVRRHAVSVGEPGFFEDVPTSEDDFGITIPRRSDSTTFMGISSAKGGGMFPLSLQDKELCQNIAEGKVPVLTFVGIDDDGISFYPPTSFGEFTGGLEPMLQVTSGVDLEMGIIPPALQRGLAAHITGGIAERASEPAQALPEPQQKPVAQQQPVASPQSAAQQSQARFETPRVLPEDSETSPENAEYVIDLYPNIPEGFQRPPSASLAPAKRRFSWRGGQT